MPTPEKKLNIAINEDYFSFKPPSLAGPVRNNIVISPIVVGMSPRPSERIRLIPDSISLYHQTSVIQRKEPSSSPIGSISTNSPSSELGQEKTT